MDEEKPDIIAQAEAETPAEATPVFGETTSEEQSTKKSKKPLYAFAVILCLAVIGAATWFLFKNKDANTPAQNQVSNNQQETPALEPVEASKLALKGNDLSDFDLAFLHLENKQDNVVYSPLSIKYALAMLKDGANGRSKEQIEALIGDYTPKAYLNSANRSLANAMFVRDSFKERVLDSYTNTLESKYHASVVLDSFANAEPLNKWVSDRTLGIINQFVDDEAVKDLDFMLVNALAIDMKWNNQLQCAPNSEDTSRPPCIYYNVRYSHENYSDWISEIFEEESFDKMTFNNHENVKSAKIGASINRYDIVKELGEEAIRNKVEEEYQKWVAEQKAKFPNSEIGYPATADDYLRSAYPKFQNGDDYDGLSKYIQELDANYGKTAVSTDFYFLDNDSERVFAKNLQEYDGTTLQYVGIMPKSGSLNAYLNNLNAAKVSSLIANLKDPNDANNFKDGVITKITAHIPFFNFEYEMKDFQTNLESLGVTDVFDTRTADLTNMVAGEKGEYIDAAIHKADINFSNDGIKAAAATGFGGRGAAGPWDYKFDVPVEEIDLTFDQPFLFLIRDKNTGEVWFTGTVYNPGKE